MVNLHKNICFCLSPVRITQGKCAVVTEGALERFYSDSVVGFCHEKYANVLQLGVSYGHGNRYNLQIWILKTK